MTDAPKIPGTAPVSDHRAVPRGVLPRSTQTWLMVGVALGMLAIILVAGQSEPAPPPSAAAAVVPQAPNADRVRDYQDRLRAVEGRAAQEAQALMSPPVSSPSPRFDNGQGVRAEDPIVAERRRREYESLFASNVVLSRRPDRQRPDAGRPAAGDVGAASSTREPVTPSIDEIADAAMRAAVRAGTATPAVPGNTPTTTTTGHPAASGSSERPPRTDPISPVGPLHRLLQGTVIDTVLMTRLDGSVAAPVNCLVTNAIYSHSGQHVLIPAGARLLGETKPVQAVGETRLAVTFDRLVMPDGRTYRLDQFVGLNQIGDAGLRDQVNQHYWSTFGASGAVGLISGLAQFLGTGGFARGDGDRTVVIAGSAADSTLQASVQTMNRFLNRLPTITIREGHRVKVYLTGDLELPAYQSATGPNPF